MSEILSKFDSFSQENEGREGQGAPLTPDPCREGPGDGGVTTRSGGVCLHCLTIVGQIEGHCYLPPSQKTTRYEHLIPTLVAVENGGEYDGLLMILNTMGGDVEAGLALAELVASMSKPTASLVLGGGHSIAVPLAAAARRSFIVPTATMTLHPVRYTGLAIHAPQTYRWLEEIQARVTGFVASHSRMSAERYGELILRHNAPAHDVGTLLDGNAAVKEGLIDEVGGLREAIGWLRAACIENRRQDTAQNAY